MNLLYVLVLTFVHLVSAYLELDDSMPPLKYPMEWTSTNLQRNKKPYLPLILIMARQPHRITREVGFRIDDGSNGRRLRLDKDRSECTFDGTRRNNVECVIHVTLIDPPHNERHPLPEAFQVMVAGRLGGPMSLQNWLCGPTWRHALNWAMSWLRDDNIPGCEGFYVRTL